MILRNGKVYISHVAEDVGRYTTLEEKLREKNINYWATITSDDSDAQLSERTRKEIAGRDVFLRICTPAAQRSQRMQLEAAAFRTIQAEDATRGTPNQHIIIDLVVDPAYIANPGEKAFLTLNTVNRPMNDWLVVLYNEAGRMQAKRSLSTRSMTILVVAGVLIAFAILVIVLIALLLLRGVSLGNPFGFHASWLMTGLAQVARYAA